MRESKILENKSSDSLKGIEILKSINSKSPLLQLRDYLTKAQQIKHENLFRPEPRFFNSKRVKEANADDVIKAQFK
jgi:hypothetical protein